MPANGTGFYQLLDRHIFGILKSKLRSITGTKFLSGGDKYLKLLNIFLMFLHGTFQSFLSSYLKRKKIFVMMMIIIHQNLKKKKKDEENKEDITAIDDNDVDQEGIDENDDIELDNSIR